MLRFNDGMTINTDGEYRVISKSDGLYVVGHGMCCPVKNAKEANELLAELKGDSNGKAHAQELH